MRLRVSSVVVVRFRLSLEGAKRKLQFTTEAFKMSDPTLPCKVVPDAVAEAIGWVASSTDEQVTAYREGVITEIEKLGLEMRKSGACDRCGLVRSWLCIMGWIFFCGGGCKGVTLTRKLYPVRLTVLYWKNCSGNMVIKTRNVRSSFRQVG